MAAKKKTTQKKTTTKKNTKAKIMYSPVGLTAEYINIPLKKKVTQEGTVNLISVPLIEGLPMQITLRKGESMEVTLDQLQQLQNAKVVESDEEYKQRIAFIKNLPNQFPDGLSAVEKAEKEKTLLTAWDIEHKIYSDKLIICD